jgi:hypothetical protein
MTGPKGVADRSGRRLRSLIDYVRRSMGLLTDGRRTRGNPM